MRYEWKKKNRKHFEKEGNVYRHFFLSFFFKHTRNCYTKCDEPFPKRQILDPSKLEEFTDNNFQFDENGRKFSKQLENTVVKGEIAHEQFLLFQVFSKDLYCRDVKTRACLGKS